LILTSSLSSLMQRISLDQQWIRELLWRHSFTTAVVGLHLNRVLGAGFQGEEFTGGLIHDLGRTLLAVACPERFAEVDLLDFVEEPDLIAREQTLLGTDHCSFGAWFVRRSGLPESLAAIVAGHHDVPRAESLTALVAAADHMANHLQRYQEPADYDADSNPGVRRLAALGCRNAPEVFRAKAVAVMEDSARDLVELTKPL
jgi:HD-like signal output (HDOD) protein